MDTNYINNGAVGTTGTSGQLSPVSSGNLTGTMSPWVPYGGSTKTTVKPPVITSTTAAKQTTDNLASLDLAQKIKSETENNQKILQAKGYDSNFTLPAGMTFNDLPDRTEQDTADFADAVSSPEEEGDTIEAPTDSPELRKMIQNRDKIFNQLSGMESTFDSQTSSLVNSIRNEYDSLIRDQEQANKAYNQGVTTANLRSGVARYAPQLSDGMIASAANQGIRAISDLEAKKNKLIIEAQRAAQEGKYNRLNSLMKSYNDTIAEQRNVAQQTYENVLSARKDERDTVQQKLDSEAAERKEKATNLKGIFEKLGEANAPKEVIAQVEAAYDATGSIGDAVAAAGDYLVGGSGIVGEYSFYKRQTEQGGGIPVSFDTYQTIDANRKRSIAAAGVANAGGLNQRQQASFERISTKFLDNPTIRNADKAGEVIAVADQVIKDPKNAANQLKALYSLVKALDPDSAVREGEVDLAQKAQSYIDTFTTALTRIEKGQIIAPETAKQLAVATKELAQVRIKTAERVAKKYEAQAKTADPVIGEAFKSFISDIQAIPTTQDQIIETNEQAKTAVDQLYSTASDEVVNTIDTLYGNNYDELQVYEYLKLKNLI